MNLDAPNQTSVPSAESEAGPPRPATRAWRWVRAVLVVAMLAGLVAIADPRRVWGALRGARYLWVLAAVPVPFVASLLDSFKMYWLMRVHDFRAGWAYVFRTNLVVNFVSMFLPGTVGGGAVAWYRLSRPGKLRAQAFAALTLHTVIKLVVLGGVGVLALGLDVRARGEQATLFACLVVAAMLPLLFLILMLWTGMASWAKRLHERTLSRILPRRVDEAARKVFEALEVYRGNRLNVVGALAAGVCRRVIETAPALMCLHAAGVEISFVRLLWILCASEVVGMLPLSTAGLGLPQVTSVGLLVLLNVATKEAAVAAEVLTKFAWLGLYATGGGVMLWESAGSWRGATAERNTNDTNDGDGSG